MKSQPIYPPLEWDPSGRQHLLLAGAEDPALAQRLLAAPPPGPLAVVHLQEGTQAPGSAWQRELPAGARHVGAADESAALARLREELEAAAMGLRLYLVGSEALIWQASRLADAFGLGEDEVRRWRTGAAARPVFCVHCRTTTRDVRTTLFACSGCARTLFVRDHFSRRLGAYMGFQADAEAPGHLPEAEPLHP